MSLLTKRSSFMLGFHARNKKNNNMQTVLAEVLGLVYTHLF